MPRLPLLLIVTLLAGCTGAATPPLDAVADADFCATIHRDTTIHLAQQLHAVDSLMATKTGVYVL